MRITGLFVSLAVAIYLWFDAPKHNKDKWLWAILGVLFSTIVLGIYLIKTERKGLGWTILILTILFYLMLLISVLIGVILFLSGAFMKKGLFLLFFEPVHQQ
ncbi:hypothetical protein [Bacillus safensis]|uniref:hypothetical protein n=1 Tax=Bacillus safensis TaxID=561879 RepID=UPI00046AADD0|nr:hypothetical protein [Bacillus safensis]